MCGSLHIRNDRSEQVPRFDCRQLHLRGPSPLASYRGEGGRSYGFLAPADERSVAAITAPSRCLPADEIEDLARITEVDAAVLGALVDTHAEVKDGSCTVRLSALLENRVLEKLPANQREALVLCVVEERSASEVAELLGVPTGTVKSRLRLARERFRTLAEKRGLDAWVLTTAGGNTR